MHDSCMAYTANVNVHKILIITIILDFIIESLLFVYRYMFDFPSFKMHYLDLVYIVHIHYIYIVYSHYISLT